LGDLEVAGAARDDVDGDVGALEERSLVCADELVGGGFGEGLAHEWNESALWRLGVDDELARDGGGDERAVGGTLDLLDGVDGGGGYDGGAVVLDGGYGAFDGVRVNQRADGVVDEDDVVLGGGGQRGEGVGDGVLAGVAAGDDVDAVEELVLGEQGGDALLFGLADCDVNAGDVGDGKEGTEGMEQDGDATELEKLFGGASCSGGHAGTNTRSGQDYEHRHGKRSIQELEGRMG
jgi:hypothetical protein